MIKLAKNDAFAAGKHHLIPLKWVASIEKDRVRLNRSSQDARREWETKNDAENQHLGSSAATGGI